MKTINLDVVNEKLYYEKLENGLDIYIIRKKDFNSNFATFVTNFGGIDIEFVPINEDKMVKMPSGIAHFLEHKLFEQEKGATVHEFYKKSGSYVNAMTGYKRTKYIFSGPTNFKDNLNFLLDFVQSPYFTEENIEKEKGIILEEAYMCLDDKNRLFNETIMKNLYNNIPYNKKVIGTIDDIKSITKEDLYRCYNSFYHPSNMALLIVTNENEEEIMKLVRENQSNKKFKNDFKIIKKEYDEDITVRKEYEEIITDVKETRLCYSLKFNSDIFKSKKLEIFDYLYIYLGIILGELSEFNLNLKEKGIIKDNIGYSINTQDSKDKEFITIHIYALTDKIDKFIKLLEKKLLSKDYTQDLFTLYKKNIISDFNYDFNSVNGIMNYMISEYEFERKIDNENIKLEMNLNYDKFKEVVNNINLDNKSIVVMKGK